MFSPLRRGVQVIRRVALPSASFGVGYACHWAWARDETAPQLLACASAKSWTWLVTGTRRVRAALPEGAEWPQERLGRLVSSELLVLANFVSWCAEQGFDSVWLRQMVLHRLCEVVEVDLRHPAVLGLAPPQGSPSACDVSGGAAASARDVSDSVILAGGSNDSATCRCHPGELATRRGPVGELALLVDDLVSALEVAPERVALPSLAALLCSLVGGSSGADGIAGADSGASSFSASSSASGSQDVGAGWAEELGPEGIVYISHSAAVAVLLLAEARRRVAMSQVEAPPAFDTAEDDLSIAEERLSRVWEALSQHAAASSAESRQCSVEAETRLADLNSRLEGLAAPPDSLPAGATCPAQNFLSQAMQLHIAAAWAGGRRPSTCNGDAERPTDGRRSLSGVGKVVEIAAWLTIAASTLVAVSADGLAILNFHAVPEEWRPAWQSMVQRQAVKVEELLAKHDPSAGKQDASMSNSIMLGPWGAQSDYIQSSS
mmetsp:Transcript_74552/g.207156  ORF Transcript_74552/g.207156 Transcript_74552/m.207156 type:complete len:491 (-) Transcript_74552:61-1533(-)